ncbi:MAG: DUF2953 domain-containing protein [Eubacteriales bacterium]|mgnify:FL=1
MVFLYIVLGLAAIITIALAARIRLNIAYKSGEDAELRVILRYLFIFRQLAPEPEKKVRLRDYTFKKTHGAKKKKKKAKDKPDKSVSGKKSSKDTVSVIRQVADIIKKSQEHLKQNLRIDISRIIIIVGASDAAKTAITYGIVSQAVSYLLEGIDSITNVRRKFRSEVNVIPDFTQREITVDIKLQLSITMWALLTVAPRVALASMLKKNPDETRA